MAFITVDMFSKSLMRTVTINAIVPVDKMYFGDEAPKSNAPYKTLYLLHGIFGNYTDWVNGTRLQRFATDHDLVVIMPSGENKFYVDNEKSGELYSTFIGKELVEVTRKLFPLSTKKEDTFIGGLSMGGYGAITNGLKYYDTFGAIIGLSNGFIIDRVLASDNNAPMPTHRRSYYESVFGNLDELVGSDKDYYALANNLIKNNIPFPKLYISIGVDDFLLEENRKYIAFLKENGIEYTYVEGPGAHEWDFWDRAIIEAIQWLDLDKHEAVSSGNVQKK